MKLKPFMEAWENDRWQRAIWQVLAFVLGLALLVNSIFFSKSQVVIVPPEIDKQFWIADNRASVEYLEQMATFLATFVGNFAPENIDYMIKIFLTYVEPQHYAEILEALKAEAEQIKQYKVSQTFSVTRTELRRGGIVYVFGHQKRFQGGTLVESTPVYELQMIVRNYKIRISRFIYHANAKEIDEEQREERRDARR